MVKIAIFQKNGQNRPKKGALSALFTKFHKIMNFCRMASFEIYFEAFLLYFQKTEKFLKLGNFTIFYGALSFR